MRSVLLIINKYFWKGYIGPIFSFFVPLLLLIFIGRIVGPTMIVPGAFMIPMISILLIFMPQSIFEFRNSTLLKRIGTTPIKPYKFLLGISIFNIIVVCVSFLLLFVFSFAIFADSLSDNVTKFEISPTKTFYSPTFVYMIRHADWGSYIYSCFLIIIMSVLIGLIIASVAKSTLFIQATGIALMLITFFVGPCILPISLVGSVDIVKYLGYLVPLKYPISTAIEAFTSGLNNSVININNSSIWNVDIPYLALDVLLSDGFNKNPEVEIFNKVDKILNISIPWILILVFSYFVAATFRWNNRGKLKVRWSIISDIYKSVKNLKTNFNRIEGSQNSKYILEVKDLVKIFKDGNNIKIGSDNISFKVERGRNIAILGSNGAGKTVLTEIITGVDRANSGTIKYNYKINKSYKDGIGIQFQDSTYPVGLSCKDIINFFVKAYKLNISEEEKNKLIEQFGISDFLGKNASNLSGGQRQRLNLLLSIIHKPTLLFLDELSTGLDIKIRNDFKSFIKKYAAENGITIVVVSHDMDEVKYLCKDVIVLEKGKLVKQESIDVILKKHNTLEEFLYDYL